MNFRTPAKTVRGLGSAKDGTAHWWAQRMTALALVPLCIWFVVSVCGLVGAGHAEFAEWLSSPFNAVAMLLLIVAGFHHAALGMQVVHEDYIAAEGCRIAAVIAVKGIAYALAVAGAFSVLKVALGG